MDQCKIGIKFAKKSGKGHYVGAVAFHNYRMTPVGNMSKLHSKHPDVNIVFSERAEFGVRGMFFIQEYLRNWSHAYTYWVTMSTQTLDEYNQIPYNTVEKLSPTMLIKTDGSKSDWYITPEYYMIGQYSKFTIKKKVI